MDFSWILHCTLQPKILQGQLSISMITIPFPSFMVCVHTSEMFITYNTWGWKKYMCRFNTYLLGKALCRFKPGRLSSVSSEDLGHAGKISGAMWSSDTAARSRDDENPPGELVGLIRSNIIYRALSTPTDEPVIGTVLG